MKNSRDDGRPPRVLYCHPGADFYGSDRMALETVKLLMDNDFPVLLVTPEAGLLTDRARTAGVAHAVVPAAVVRKRYLTVLAFPVLAVKMIVSTARGVALLMRTRPGVVFVNTITQPSWMVAAAVLRIPLVVHVRELEDGGPRLVQRGLLAPVHLADRILCNSRSTETWVRSNLLRRRPEQSVSTVYNGKDWPVAERAGAALAGAPVEVLLVGRVSPRKGQDIALEAMSVLRRSGVDARLTIAGSVFAGYENYEAQLRRQCGDLGLADVCTFLGYVEDTASLYSRADVTWIPSRQEPFGSIALESMACRTPVVTSGVEGLAEIVEDGVTGLHFVPEDPTSLATRTLQLIQDLDLTERIVEAAFDMIDKRFSLDRYIDDITSVIRDLLDDRPTGPLAARQGRRVG